MSGIGSFRRHYSGKRKFGTYSTIRNRYKKGGYRTGFKVKSRNSAMSRSFGIEAKAARLLLHPFKGAYKGLKYPDSDSSASVPLTIRHLLTLTPSDTDTSGSASSANAAAIRILPTGDYQLVATQTSSVNGEMLVLTWTDPQRVPDWTTYDGSFSKYRLINYGYKLHYIGNDETNSGKYTIMVHPYGAGTVPLNSNSTVTYSKSGAIKDLRGLIVEPRRISVEAMHYEPVVVFGQTGYVTLDDAWEMSTLFLEAASTTAQPVAIELIWNFECLPGNGSLSSAVASPALPDLPHIMNKVTDLGTNMDRCQPANSSAGQNSGPNLAAIIGQAVSMAAGYGLSSAMRRYMPRGRWAR